ncbi:MAG: hypothetical protein IJ828_06155 [Treponema sp.]|nr:hypothetical protein [Treponema sp.]
MTGKMCCGTGGFGEVDRRCYIFGEVSYDSGDWKARASVVQSFGLHGNPKLVSLSGQSVRSSSYIDVYPPSTGSTTPVT